MHDRGWDRPHVTVPVEHQLRAVRLSRHTMTSQTTVDALSTGVGQLDISGRHSPEYITNGNDVIFTPKVSICKPVKLSLHTDQHQTLTRDYMTSRQPWDAVSLPPQYVPNTKHRRFPPLFFLGVILTIEEVCHLARCLGLSFSGDGDETTYYVVARRLSEICGFTVPDTSYPLHRVTVEQCDTKGQTWMIALFSNYHIPHGLDYSDSYTKMIEALEKAFGESKKMEWWLEHTFNHTPKDPMVCG